MSMPPSKRDVPTIGGGASADPPVDHSDAVGYGRPPAKNRFKAGQSGNPRGRPKGARNKIPALNEERLKSIILNEAYRTIKVNDGPRQVNIPMAQAIVRSLAVNAVKGQHRSQRLFSELLSATEREDKALHDEYLKTVLDYKTEWEEAIDHCKKLGLPAPDPVPHPDHIDLDMRTGQIIVDGPMTRAQRDKGRKLIARLLECREELTLLSKERAKSRNIKVRAIIDLDIGHETRLHDKIMNLTRTTPWMQRELAHALAATRKSVEIEK